MSLYVDIEKRLGDFTLQAELRTQGGMTALLGASGCGKSMTLKCIAGIVSPDRGHIELDGRVLYDSDKGIDLPPQQRKVGYLFQNYALFPNMTVEKNILCALRGQEKRERDRTLKAAVAQLRLEGLEKRYPAQLSGGQQQRAALARILVTDPRLLLLDEPFSALDTHLRDLLQPQLRALLEQLGKETLMVTHSREEAYRMCGQICVMDAGRVLRFGETHAVFEDPGSVAAARLTGCKNIAAAKATGPNSLEVPAWGLALTLNRPVPANLAAVGVRAHDFQLAEGEDGFAVVCHQVLEEPFEWNILFRFTGQSPDSQELWWRFPKDRLPDPLPTRLVIPQAELLLLK